DEIRSLLASSDGLAFIRGKWVEVDSEKLKSVLERFQQVEREAAASGISFVEAMRLVAGAAVTKESFDDGVGSEWAGVAAGPWLTETLKGLRSPEGLARVDAGNDLQTALRPYQQSGLHWLHLLSRLGLGACLADDMGLGKTLQILALLLVLKRQE